MNGPRREALPEGIAGLADFEAHARARLSEPAWAYFSGGAADELSLRANRTAWDALRLHPRVLRELAGGHTRTHLLDRELPHPILLAPIAYQQLAHADGEIASAYAAAAQDAGLILSAQSSTPLETVAQAMAGGAGPLWFQLYIQPDRGFTRELVQRVEAAGYQALVLTVDAPVQGARDRERRAGFKLPAPISAVNLAGAIPPARAALGSGQSALFDGLLSTAASWRDVEWLHGITRLPLLLKGVQHADDARQAMDLGAAGLVVSNHGGRTLDTVAATAELLPYLAEALRARAGPRASLLVDGGIRRGTDVLKAIALGADAVLLGRPYVHALATAGALGVAHALRLLRDELEIAMALCGCKQLSEAGPHLLWQTRP
ncbi:alpha-hydroxy acid oxidase [Paucibacter sp. M5-1]|uniref:alpha-hydroxy acid oxidase n=1 Tax=Paucibacter sp. M5-1 TaxID=3015998 RepID=UPI0022B9216B|nr:alpha-hydroxy acid oxidase [Paucibacter sp. M5-1]MCZ7881776.1 alpha-hydroxy acid oxidase [Paucibacter sp. M5-1]